MVRCAECKRKVVFRLRIVKMKGYGLSLNYPVPEHRTSSDIDIYLYGEGGLGDALARERFGCEVKQNVDKHSVFLVGCFRLSINDTFLFPRKAQIINVIIQ